MRLNVTMVSDAHTTIDNKLLTAAQIIGHHNALLNGFDAGARNNGEPNGRSDFRTQGLIGRGDQS